MFQDFGACRYVNSFFENAGGTHRTSVFGSWHLLLIKSACKCASTSRSYLVTFTSILLRDLACAGLRKSEYSDHRKENVMGGIRGNVRFFLTIPIVILAIAAFGY